MKRCLAIAALLLALSCDSPTGLIPGELAVRVTPPTLQLTNQTPAAVYFFAIDGKLAMVANWAPCTDPTSCLAIAPATSEDLPYSQIAGYEAGAQTAIVYWWHLVPEGATGFRPDSIRAAAVRL